MLKVSSNKRCLVTSNGHPFFYLGDTAWELFHRLSPADVEFYLTTRAQQGFNVIQAVALAEHDFQTPNYHGDLPLKNNDPEQPVESYFRNVDDVVNRINTLGMVVGFLPTWGDKWNKKWGVGPEIFTVQNAERYGRYLGSRYREANLIWILGGDRAVESDNQRAILDALAKGLAAGDRGTHLLTFHPQGGRSSMDDVAGADWLSFNMWQTGHHRGVDTAACIRRDYRAEPPMPVMDAEPCYEDHPAGFDVACGYISAFDVRRAIYSGIFAGGFGVTYGCHSVWQFTSNQFQPINYPVRLWQEALGLPGATQMQYLRRLIESRPALSRIPDDGLIVGSIGALTVPAHACRDEELTYALVYLPAATEVTVNLGAYTCQQMRASWYSPRSGTCQSEGCVSGGGVHSFTTPGYGPDWVLCLDDVRANYNKPGSHPLAANVQD